MFSGTRMTSRLPAAWTDVGGAWTMAAAAMAAARREAERTVSLVRAVRVLPEMLAALRYRYHDSLKPCVACHLERANGVAGSF